MAIASPASTQVASSPTCEFGRILHHLVQSVENPNDEIIFVGTVTDVGDAPPEMVALHLTRTLVGIDVHDDEVLAGVAAGLFLSVDELPAVSAIEKEPA